MYTRMYMYNKYKIWSDLFGECEQQDGNEVGQGSLHIEPADLLWWPALL